MAIKIWSGVICVITYGVAKGGALGVRPANRAGVASFYAAEFDDPVIGIIDMSDLFIGDVNHLLR